MNKEERVKLVKAMEYIVRNVNDERVFATWLTDGVADGDIEYGDLSYDPEDEDMIDLVEDDDSFADLMDSFLYVMARARKSGGLYCDGVTGGERRNV